MTAPHQPSPSANGAGHANLFVEADPDAAIRTDRSAAAHAAPRTRPSPGPRPGHPGRPAVEPRPLRGPDAARFTRPSGRMDGCPRARTARLQAGGRPRRRRCCGAWPHAPYGRARRARGRRRHAARAQLAGTGAARRVGRTPDRGRASPDRRGRGAQTRPDADRRAHRPARARRTPAATRQASATADRRRRPLRRAHRRAQAGPHANRAALTCRTNPKGEPTMSILRPRRTRSRSRSATPTAASGWRSRPTCRSWS